MRRAPRRDSGALSVLPPDDEILHRERLARRERPPVVIEEWGDPELHVLGLRPAHEGDSQRALVDRSPVPDGAVREPCANPRLRKGSLPDGTAPTGLRFAAVLL